MADTICALMRLLIKEKRFTKSKRVKSVLLLDLIFDTLYTIDREQLHVLLSLRGKRKCNKKFIIWGFRVINSYNMLVCLYI